jgi:hypothetical protein
MQDRPMAHDTLGGGSERLGGAAVGAADRMLGCGGGTAGSAVGPADRMLGGSVGAGARASAAVGPADRILGCGAAAGRLADAKPPAGLGLTMFDLSSRS